MKLRSMRMRSAPLWTAMPDCMLIAFPSAFVAMPRASGAPTCPQPAMSQPRMITSWELLILTASSSPPRISKPSKSTKEAPSKRTAKSGPPDAATIAPRAPGAGRT